MSSTVFSKAVADAFKAIYENAEKSASPFPDVLPVGTRVRPFTTSEVCELTRDTALSIQRALEDEDTP